MVFFYLVTTGWIFDISLCEKKKKNSVCADFRGGECCTLRYRIDITRANQKPLLHITRTNHLAHLAVFDIVINLRRP